MSASATTREHAIILAAGTGTRLAPHTNERPKVLVSVAGEPLLLRQLRQLSRCGVRSATVVTGDRASQVEEAALQASSGIALEFIFSPEYATTNNSRSLSLTADVLRRGTLLVEGDVVADDVVFEALVASRETCWLVRPFLPGMDGAVLRPGRDGTLAQLTIVKHGADVAPGAFKSMGLLRIDPGYGARLAQWLDLEVRTTGGRRYYDLVVADNLSETGPKLLPVEDGFWAEIDTPEDLERAERALGGGRANPGQMGVSSPSQSA